MKAFEFTRPQIAEVVAALVADEVSSRFRRRVSATRNGVEPGAASLRRDEGFGLGAPEVEAVRRRISGFFDLAAGVDALNPDAVDVNDWASAIEIALRQRCALFRFTPAGRDSETEACAHRADAIFTDAAAVATLLYGRRRVVSLVAPHSLIGFTITVLAPNLQQIPTLDARAVPPDDLKKELAFGDAVVATPSLWRYLLREGVTAPDNTLAVYFGEQMSKHLAAELRQAGFGAQREIYGSTETGLIGWRDSPGEPFTLFDAIARDSDGLTRTSPDGDVVKFTAMDEFDWADARNFRLIGRRDGAVQIGAINVFPARVAEIIRQHEYVADCDVKLSQHQGGFNRLVARIVLASAGPPPESIVRSIDQWCRLNLEPQERPRIYRFERSL